MSIASWVSANGTTLALDGSAGVKVLRGASGLDVHPRMLTVANRVGSPGGVIVNMQQPPRTVSLPIFVDTSTISAAAVAALFHAGGTLVADSGRELRELAYLSGLEGVWSVDAGGVTGFNHRKFPLELLATEPFWYGPAVTETFVFGDPTAWDAPISWDAAIPWNGGSGVTITVEGEAPTSPLWTITGAATSVTVGNGVQAWTWTQSLATPAYSSVEPAYGTVDQRPGTRSPRLGSNLYGVAETGYGLWSLLSNDSILEWGLAPGVNELIVSAGGKDASSKLDLWYEPRWLVPG